MRMGNWLFIVLILFGTVQAHSEFEELGAFAQIAPNDNINIEVEENDGKLEEWQASTVGGSIKESKLGRYADWSTRVKAKRRAIDVIYNAGNRLEAYHVAKGKGLVSIEFRAWDRKILAFIGDFFSGIYFFIFPPKIQYDFSVGTPIVVATVSASPEPSPIPTATPTPIIGDIIEYDGYDTFGLDDEAEYEPRDCFGDGGFGTSVTGRRYPVNRSIDPINQSKYGENSCGPSSAASGFSHWGKNGYPNLTAGGLHNLTLRLHELMGTDGTNGVSIGRFLDGIVGKLNESGYAENFTVKFWLEQYGKPPQRRFRVHGIDFVNNNAHPVPDILKKEMEDGETVIIGVRGRGGLQHIAVLQGLDPTPDADGSIHGRVMDPYSGSYVDVVIDEDGSMRLENSEEWMEITFVVSVSPKEGSAGAG